MKLSQTKRARAMRKMRMEESEYAKKLRCKLIRIAFDIWNLKTAYPQMSSAVRASEIELAKHTQAVVRADYRALSKRERGLE